MKILHGAEAEEATKFIDAAARIARDATCNRKKCGTIIVKSGKVIGQGYNSPPGDMESQRRCGNDKNSYDKRITDKTCCIHAEQRAIIDALRRNPDSIKGSTLYFVRLNDNDVKTFSGNPYCTICSKMALDSGVKEFVLWHETGIIVYDTVEYNNLSYAYRE